VSPAAFAGARASVDTPGLWADRRNSGTVLSQTRAPNRASVVAEGGGTVTPALGGGFGFSREQEAARAAGEGCAR